AGGLPDVATFGLSAADIHSLYPPVRGPGIDRRIAVLGLDAPLLAASVTRYRELEGLGQCPACLAVVSAPALDAAAAGPSSGPTDAVQNALTGTAVVEAAVAACPNCRITYVRMSDTGLQQLGNAFVFAVQSLRIRTVVSPYTTVGQGQYDAAALRSYFAVRGVTFLVAAGDTGAYWVPGLPATAPDALAVGGTSVHRSGAGWLTDGWPGTAAACATFVPRPSWQRPVPTGCPGRAVTDLSAAADPQVSPLSVVLSLGSASFARIPVGGTAVAAGLLAGWASASGLGGTLTPAWLYAHHSFLLDVRTGRSNQCVVETGPCQVRWDSGSSDRVSTPRSGWDGVTGWGTPS
nr:hypothetical protein [Actinomycetota bacterium]